MTFDTVQPIVRAVLYEGYLLYPYRLSALKNRYRWMFGRLLPQEFSLAHGGDEPWRMQVECLIRCTPRTRLTLSVRCLQLLDSASAQQASPVTAEREITHSCSVAELVSPHSISFAFEPRLEGTLHVTATRCESDLIQLTVATENRTPGTAALSFDAAIVHSLLSALTLLHVEQGEFLSLIDPPVPYVELARGCQNIGTWPVLVGAEPGAMMLAAPIILYDYAQIAPESPGDSFDGTEIDELLALRIQTLTDDEKQEMRAAGQHTQVMLQRTNSLSQEQLLQLHGRLRISRPSAGSFQPGDRVRLNPRRRADAFDLMLAGREATVVAVEHDFENRVHLAVVIDDDPGRSLGVQGLPGHRFFYSPEEVERL